MCKNLKKKTLSALTEYYLLTGIERFELSHDGVRDRCLTAWLYPKINRNYYNTISVRLLVFILFYPSYAEFSRRACLEYA